MPEVSVSTTAETIVNPLDLIEEIISAHEWPFDRANDDELMAQTPGKWCDYRMYFAWSADMSALGRPVIIAEPRSAANSR